MDPVLILTDLDRTLIPNGHQPESPQARVLFRRLANDKDVMIAYVSGRDLNLLKSAIAEYDLPTPDYAIGDVGTSLYQVTEEGWHQSAEWQETIASNWHGVTTKEIIDRLKHITALTLQEPKKQGPHKISYYTSTDIDPEQLKRQVADALTGCEAEVSMIHSVDEIANTGLFDILPKGANKLYAIRFLIDTLGFQPQRTVYSGDSGNDMEVLISEIRSTLVGNADRKVKEVAQANAPEGTLYLAQGNFLEMNGNYCAGILEGLAQFIPEMNEKILQCAKPE